MLNKKTVLAALLTLIVAVLVVVGIKTSASASGEEPECVPADAYTETIEHPEVSHLVHHDAVTHEETEITIPEVWANFSPDHQEGPFTGPPAWPSDERGTWHLHDKIPGGHEGPDGVYQRDNPGQGNADWFYRHGEETRTIVVVDQQAFDETVIDIEAWTEEIEHPAVVCTGEQPDPVVSTSELSSYKCGDDFETHTLVTVTAEYVLQDGEWVLGDPVTTTDEEQVPVEATPCDVPEEEPNPDPHTTPTGDHPVPQQHTQSVPTLIEAGL